MPLRDNYPDAVVFIIGWRTDPETNLRKKVPIGTGFIVGVPGEMDPGSDFLHVVTAAHVVQFETETWIRFNRLDGGVRDLAVHQWILHPGEMDVAVTPMTARSQDWLRYRTVGVQHFVDAPEYAEVAEKVSLGDRVYFIGLLANMTQMAEANIPMVRSGTVGRLYQAGVALRRPDESILRTTAHLIDCRSYGGFSGSPCFIQFEYTKYIETPYIEGGMIGDVLHEATVLLGLVSGHWDDWHEAKISGDLLGKVESVVNTGVGIVTPAEMIRETLYQEDYVAVRKQAEEIAQKKAEEEPATTDSAGTPETFTERDFDDALKKVSRPEKK